MKEIGLYVHIPFCIKKCYYCDFTSYEYDENSINRYSEALKKEINIYGSKLSDYRIKSIYLGGGTPSILDLYALNSVIDSIYKNFNICSGVECTIESNPGTLTEGKLKVYYEMGINRLSIGLQSFNNKILKSIGRIHSSDIFLKNYFQARKVGFNNINVDLMYGLPGQSIDDWKETLKKVIEIQPDHISAYALKIEEGTKLYNIYINDELQLPSEEEDRQMYHFTIDFLESNCIKQYEISNFSRKGYECIHNLIYWQNKKYLGLGVSAHSYLHSYRYSNVTNLDEYFSILNKGKLPIKEKEIVNRNDEIFETMFLGLRLTKGINIMEFKKRFGISPYDIYGDKIKKLVALGLVCIEDNNIRLTRYGMDVSNEVFTEFIVDSD